MKIRSRFLAFLVFGLFGCSLLNKDIAKPEAKVLSVAVQDVTAQALELVFDVHLANPNPFKLEVDSLDYMVEISGRKLTEGRMDSGIQLPAAGEVVLKVPLKLQLSELFSSVEELFLKRKANYKVTGAANIGLFDIPFSRSGELKLR